MDQNYSNQCPLCSGTVFINYKFELLKCECCGIVLSPLIWLPQVNDAMDETFGLSYQARLSKWVNLFEKWNNWKTLRRLQGAKVHGRRLFEIGVGSGAFLVAARSQGYQVMGCDLSKPICERIMLTHNITMHNQSLTSLLGKKSFDVIVLNHVLEHVNDPICFLREVSHLLAPGGIVHIAVPNIACFEAMFSGWTGYQLYHLSYFDPKTVERTVTASGLCVKKIITPDSFSGWFMTLLRTAKNAHQNTGDIKNQSVPSLTKETSGKRSSFRKNAYHIVMITSGILLWPWRYIQAKLGQGDEIICIAYHSNSINSVEL